MTKKKNPFARTDLLCSPTKFYDSKTRKNRYGNTCDLCHEDLEGDCKRAIWGINQWGNNNYTTVHEKCFVKTLKVEIKKSIKENDEEQKAFHKSINELRGMIKK